MKEFAQLRNDTINFRMWSKIDEARDGFYIIHNSLTHRITAVRCKSYKIQKLLVEWVARKDHPSPLEFVQEVDEQH